MPVIYVHGVNVRLDDFGKREPIVREKMRKFGPDSDFFSYFWGGHTINLHWGGRSIPGVLESDADLEPLVTGTPVALPDIKTLLLLNPWIEIQSLIPDAPPTGGAEYKKWVERNDFLFDNRNKLKAALAKSLAAYPDAADAQFIGALVETAAGTDGLARKTGGRVDEVAIQPILARALTAAALRRLPDAYGSNAKVGWDDVAPQVEAAVREAYSGQMGGVVSFFASPLLSFGTWMLRSGFRTSVMPTVMKFLGDVFIYLQNREEYLAALDAFVVKAIEDEKAQRGKKTPLWFISHSLGGIMVYDYCCWKKEREVERLITIGCQVGLFAEGDLLYDKHQSGWEKTGRPIADNIAEWFHVYDPNDMLGFRAAPIFGAKDEKGKNVPQKKQVIESVYDSGVSFPDSHSAYWDADSVYKDVCKPASGGGG